MSRAYWICGKPTRTPVIWLPITAPPAANDIRARRAVGVSTSVAIAIVLALACRAASAGSATANLSVTATVQNACATSAGPMAFAPYTAGRSPVTGSATITVKCSSGLAFKVALGPGATPGGSISQRLLSNGSQSLQYNLYTTSDLSSIWGDGTTGVTLSGMAPSEGLATSLTVFAELPDSAMNRLATPGIYTDLVTVTITY
jgi:spore coat protein U-like protein